MGVWWGVGWIWQGGSGRSCVCSCWSACSNGCLIIDAMLIPAALLLCCIVSNVVAYIHRCFHQRAMLRFFVWLHSCISPLHNSTGLSTCRSRLKVRAEPCSFPHQCDTWPLTHLCPGQLPAWCFFQTVGSINRGNWCAVSCWLQWKDYTICLLRCKIPRRPGENLSLTGTRNELAINGWKDLLENERRGSEKKKRWVIIN